MKVCNISKQYKSSDTVAVSLYSDVAAWLFKASLDIFVKIASLVH